MAINSSTSSDAEEPRKLREWKRAYHAAVLESDPRKLPERVQAAGACNFQKARSTA
jgi:hypothetical protein